MCAVCSLLGECTEDFTNHLKKGNGHLGKLADILDSSMMNRVKVQTITCSYLLNKLLSASAWSSLNFCRKHCLMTSLLMWCSSHLQRRQLPITRNKQLISTCTFLFPNLSSHYVVGIRLFCLAPVRNTVIPMLQSNHLHQL